jgi:hypothetical protein
VWFDYARLEEGACKEVKDEGATEEEEEATMGRVREVYERAVSQVPPGTEKRHWRRYIFLWLNYALFEEIENKVRDGMLSAALNEAVSYTHTGLRTGTTNLPNCVATRPTQAVHVC